MFCQSRKGVEKDFLVFMIIAIVGFIIIAFVINIFMSNANKEVNEEVCRASILARAKAVVKMDLGPFSTETPVVFPIVCKTQENIELSGDKDAVMEQISYMSARCWWMFLNGEYENIFGKPNFLRNNRCFICYIFTVKSKLKEPITPEDIITYMDEHYYLGDEKEGVTYLDYIQSYKGDGVVMMRDTEEDKLKIEGGGKNVYTIRFMSPDINWWDHFTQKYFYNPIKFWKTKTEKSQELESLTMAKIYIEDLDVNSKGECDTDLESI